ncbi:MAG: tyrosine-protein phosphatase [Candidatus Adiutricales bacterium]
MKLNKNVIKNPDVERKGDDLNISWETAVEVKSVIICAGESPEKIDKENPIARVSDKTRFTVSNMDPKTRYYFELSADDADGRGVITAERRIPLTGSVNFRDLGGYETVDGRQVKWGRIFRSDSLARLTEDDQSYLREMGIKTVCDFRSPSEVEDGPDRLPDDGSIRYVNLPVFDDEFAPTHNLERLRSGDSNWLTDDFFVKSYIRNIDQFGPTWGTVFKYLADDRNRPMVFHCTGGKDRAGQFAALLLLALGVPDEVVIHDHGLTNKYIAGLVERIYARFAGSGVPREKLELWFTASRAGITGLLEHLYNEYGSPAEYIRTTVGLDEETLARMEDELLE